MIYILFILMSSHVNSGNDVEIHTQEFSSQTQCEHAAKVVKSRTKAVKHAYCIRK